MSRTFGGEKNYSMRSYISFASKNLSDFYNSSLTLIKIFLILDLQTSQQI